VTTPDRLLFLHIPKSGGTTLSKILTRQYADRHFYFYKYGWGKRSLAEFSQLDEADEARESKIVRGHFCFGLHQYLPGPSRYITMLRDPVDRAISHFYYVARSPDHPQHRQVVEQRLTLHQFLQDGMAKEIQNFQTLAIAGINVQDMNQPTAADLQQAIANLRQHFVAVGTTERFDDTLILMQAILGWSAPVYVKQNVTLDRPAASDIPQETQQLIRDLNPYDVELYDYVDHLLDELIAKHVPGFRLKLWSFQRQNTLYNLSQRWRRSAPSSPSSSSSR
jgi:hypothetical protein